MQFVSQQLYVSYNFPKFKGAKDGHLAPNDPVNAPVQTN